MSKSKLTTKATINRIIIGDVGSGKTIVAFLVALCFQKNLNRTQVALTAPTEVLAYQHYQSFMAFLTTVKDSLKQHFPTTIYLASGKYFINGEPYTKKKFEAELSKIQGNIFWIGTHAIFYNEAVSPELIFIDEQHRFGVQQRQKLTLTSRNPHFVSLSATPIPRTLALTFYESLQPHFLETLASRNPIITTQETFEKFDDAVIPQIKREVTLGHKVYIICPLIDDNEDSDMWSTNKTTKLLQEYFPDQVLTVHGKDKAKKSILEQFKSDPSKSILVATTVVEVGVDVPQATLVVILNSERFGLSALHQIRGRVGRNDFEKNYCILVTWDKFKFIKRLNYLKEIHSGFALAEKDLELRGAGDVMGKMQSGFGQDFDDIVQLDPAVYEQVTGLTSSLDYENLEELPRLKNYLQTKLKEIHQE